VKIEFLLKSTEDGIHTHDDDMASTAIEDCKRLAKA
jgi:hypothetical protein